MVMVATKSHHLNITTEETGKIGKTEKDTAVEVEVETENIPVIGRMKQEGI